MTLTNYHKGLLTLATTLGLGFALGLGLGWKLYQPKPEAQIIKAQPAERQKDGSLILETNPQAAPKAARVVPAGAKVDRTIKVKLEPSKAYVEALVRTPEINPEDKASHSGGKNYQNIPPMTIDLTLLTTKDGSQRVAASSPDGNIIGGLDIPAIRPSKPEPKWAAGALCRLTQSGRVYGAFVDRDFGPFRTSVELARSLSSGVYGWEAGGRIGIRW